ncbi:39S ribosomal protein L39, mitochondrial-like isoform X1 [Varroa jacobsoni]|uniref:39S ribosomal protein L39, mitochondrial-like isoform X1 n=1 Tax=Varroa jacobsoni TaxID=62625 RepID=UPI000BF982FF|nr:39S ribosomal protein L39, mitochondrial-like isoform X1 [Varroa jacobsoni]
MVRKSIHLAHLVIQQPCKHLSSNPRLSNTEAIAKRNTLFSNEKSRQASLVTRVTKIKVKYEGTPKPCTMIMNKDMSTPYDCAKHLPEPIRKRAVIAYVDGKPWDMHRPLEGDCTLNLAHFKDPNKAWINMVNKAFWRSCSFLLGYAIERAFKDEHHVLLHSWPAPAIESGSFVYDVALSVANWRPRHEECRILGSSVQRLTYFSETFERLEVDAGVAKQMFEDNKFKYEQVDHVAAASKHGTVILYRCGDHVDMSCGPMIANTSQVTHFNVVSVHPFETPIGLMQRFQGVAIPSFFTMSPFARNVLKKRALAMNTTGLPQEATQTLEDAEANLAKAKEEEENVDHDENNQHDYTPKEHQAAQ